MLTSQRVEVSQSLDDMYDEMCKLGWTDGLPVIPPTEERVQLFVDYVGRDPGEIVATIPPDNGVATIEKVAINAVMAGCRPDYMPVLLAAIAAVTGPGFGLNDIQCTTNPATPFLILNGPIRNQLEINCGTNALGQGWRANATIGRALRLLLVNVGGAMPGTGSKATLGQPGRFTMCLGENEEENPWVPLHVERGLSASQSAVTVVPASGTLQISSAGTKGADSCLSILARSIAIIGTNDMKAPLIFGDHNEPVLILCPLHARLCAEAGLSKQDVKRILWERARIPIDWFPEELAKDRYDFGRVVDGMVPIVGKPEDLIVVVAGGSSGGHSTYVPTFAAGHVSITKLIQVS